MLCSSVSSIDHSTQSHHSGNKTVSLQLDNHVGNLAPEHSFLTIQAGNVAVTALKKSEDDNSLVLRFYEFEGKDGDVAVPLLPGATTTSEADLIERKSSSLSMRDGTPFVHTKPYEIKTLNMAAPSQ